MSTYTTSQPSFGSSNESKMQMQPHQGAAPLIWTYIIVLTFMLILSFICYCCRLFRGSTRPLLFSQNRSSREATSQQVELESIRLPSEMKIVIQPDETGFVYAIREEFFDNMKKQPQNQKNNVEKKGSMHYMYTTDQIEISTRVVEDEHVNLEIQNVDKQENEQINDPKLQIA
eukprot:TRINITY_DN1513_c0_g1_i12.p2 TRINITY_DN1513_c0_g1~~TRINITY_DN1513_c0_g1_i12.p2  ORF type:complete len:173 (-),score=11.87 TRINITY_DN1513_c0_g1_i12:641-1159(-)